MKAESSTKVLDLGLGVPEPDLLGDGGELVRDAAEPGGGEAEGDCPADAVGGAGDDGLELGAALQELAGDEKIGADQRCVAH